MKKGLIQIYYGNGKGKTTAAMGQALRAAGHGMSVLIYQFLKGTESGEVRILKTLPGVRYVPNEIQTPFLFNLTPEQEEYFREQYAEEFGRLAEEIRTGCFDMAVLDEVLDAVGFGMVPEEALTRLMEEKPEGTELVLTGHEYQKDLSGIFDRADYITDCVKIKHPFDRGEECREGIEE